MSGFLSGLISAATKGYTGYLQGSGQRRREDEESALKAGDLAQRRAQQQSEDQIRLSLMQNTLSNTRTDNDRAQSQSDEGLRRWTQEMEQRRRFHDDEVRMQQLNYERLAAQGGSGGEGSGQKSLNTIQDAARDLVAANNGDAVAAINQAAAVSSPYRRYFSNQAQRQQFQTAVRAEAARWARQAAGGSGPPPP